MSEEKIIESEEEEVLTEDLISINLTRQEVQALVSLLDTAVRSKGLDVAANAAIIHQRIVDSVRGSSLK